LRDYRGQGRISGPETNENRKQKEKIMTINTGKNQYAGPLQSGPAKTTMIAAAKAALRKPFKTEKAVPSHEEIVVRAYEIWLATGQQPGHDQEHWFQAERELRTA
jgi:hypothetical protein